MRCRIRGFDAGGEWVRVSLEIEDASEALAEVDRMGISSPDIHFSGCKRPPLHPTGGACRLRCSILGVDEAGGRRTAMVQVDSEAEALAAADRMGIQQPRFRWYGHWPAPSDTPHPQEWPTEDVGAAESFWVHFWKGLVLGFIGGFIGRFVATFRPFRRD